MSKIAFVQTFFSLEVSNKMIRIDILKIMVNLCMAGVMLGQVNRNLSDEKSNCKFDETMHTSNE